MSNTDMPITSFVMDDKASVRATITPGQYDTLVNMMRTILMNQENTEMRVREVKDELLAMRSFSIQAKFGDRY